ncbi:MAG: dTDP-4-dehydrorhamnose reductase [Candidatus Sungbacteria bacterium]|uniref:dTDP-4-dehydrorhamnose reductase n=1 Tax=Candidatus Sungiibacteriota bacterium TaxID=2750080 RepID=A0A932VR81_9BACT|nr:dTDP-4-dehydrorhamnose reductase [Candidatus Sungbacteria bacterium]
MQTLLVIGSSGQLARAIKALRPDATYLDRSRADLSKPNELREVLESFNPSAVINAAAYTQVDNAEKEEELATAVNGFSPEVMAKYCAGRNIPLVHFSTDYIFDGSGEKPWCEDDAPSPLNAYGRSKLAGEKAIAQAGGKYLIFRTSWVYDAEGKNFVNTILRLAAEREELKIIADQHGAPTYAPHLGKGALEALTKTAEMSQFPSGIYHLCNRGTTTWHGFASAIVEHGRRRGIAVKVKNIVPISTSEYPLPARRPFNSRLDCARALSMFGVSLPDWQEGLADCMERK